MKSDIRSVTVIATTLGIATGVLVAAELHSVQPGDLTVHEWGTFTSVAGEDGAPVQWNVLGCKSDLPGFVNDTGYRNLKFRLAGTVRMETPVMYFYSPREATASVKVQFPRGVITEWYPNGDHGSGAIAWSNLKIQPGSTADFPVDKGPSRYYAARGTDAAPLTVGEQHEKFLFYRGVGRFPIPLSVRVSGYGQVTVENRSHDAVPEVILFENHAGRIGFRIAGPFGGTLALDEPALDADFSQLRHELEATLIAQGLFPKEAHAMVETWRDSWFEEGSRLIYVVPSAAVDAILPLDVEPAPSQTARVFVGRIELVTPETKRAVETAIAKNDWVAVDRYSRFLVPILHRIYPGNPSKVGEVEQQVAKFQASSGGACQ